MYEKFSYSLHCVEDRTGGSDDIIVPTMYSPVWWTVGDAAWSPGPLWQWLCCDDVVTTNMSSASQIDHATMSEDQLAEMLSKMKSSRETEALRARLPAQLAPFASNISIIKLIQTVHTSPTGGVHCCSCRVRDMGFRECELDNKLEVIEALLGDDGSQLLESHSQDGTTLRKIIEDEPEEEDHH